MSNLENTLKQLRLSGLMQTLDVRLLRIGILTVQCAPREMGFLCFNIELVVVYQTKLFDPEQLTTSNFARRLVPVCDLLFVY